MKGNFDIMRMIGGLYDNHVVGVNLMDFCVYRNGIGCLGGWCF